MVEEYDIFMGETVVGTATVEKQGLYYRLQCRCRLPKDGFCRITVTSDTHHENLGVLLPKGDGFYLNTKIAAKRMGQGKLEFRAISKLPPDKERFYPVYPEEPFAYLAKLKNAFLAQRNGQVGVIIPD